MKVAKAKVWADAEGNLVPDGDESAAVLVAAAGQTVPDAHVAQYKGGDKFFSDAVFDSNSQPVMPKTIAPAKAPEPQTSTMVDGGPEPQNREQAMPKRKTRAKKAAK